MPRKGSPKPDAVSMQIELRKDSLAAFEEYVRAKAKDRKAALGRLIEWFVEQDETHQAIIMGQINREDEPEVAVQILARLAGGPASLRRRLDKAKGEAGTAPGRRRKPRAG